MTRSIKLDNRAFEGRMSESLERQLGDKYNVPLHLITHNHCQFQCNPQLNLRRTSTPVSIFSPSLNYCGDDYSCMFGVSIVCWGLQVGW